METPDCRSQPVTAPSQMLAEQDPPQQGLQRKPQCREARIVKEAQVTCHRSWTSCAQVAQGLIYHLQTSRILLHEPSPFTDSLELWGNGGQLQAQKQLARR